MTRPAEKDFEMAPFIPETLTRRPSNRPVAILLCLLCFGCSNPLGFMGVEKVERTTEVIERESFSMNSLDSVQDGMINFARDTNAFAEEELARLNAAELAYRNSVYRHTFRVEETGETYDIYAKVYREYQKHAVVGMSRTMLSGYNRSILFRLNSDVVASTAYAADNPQNLLAAQADNEFQTIGTDEREVYYPFERNTFDPKFHPPAAPRPAEVIARAPTHVWLASEPVDVD